MAALPLAPAPVADPADAVIVAAGLTRRFGRGAAAITAVDGLDLAVSRGDILGIVGPDGAGKTTTLRLLAALMNPTAGHAVIFGHDSVRGAARIKAHIGYVAQRFALYGDLTVRENALFYADLFGVPHAERQERLERLLSATDLLRFGERRAAHLSGGMQRKLALACVLIHTPELILLDEPTTGVDPVSRREFWEILANLHLDGITLVISTPYMDEAEQCTRVALMMHGRLAVCDTPARIKAMVPGELVAVWPADMRRAQQALAGLEGIHEIQPYGDQLRILGDDAAALMPRIRARLAEHGVALHDLRPGRVRMEEAFVSLTGAHPAAAPGNGDAPAVKEA